MANYYGANYTAAYQSEPSSQIPPGDQGGVLRVASDSYAATGALTTSDKLYMLKLPKGAKVIDVILASTDLGTTGDFNVGWEANGVDTADEDGFLAAADVNAAAVVHRMTSAANLAGQFKEFGAETDITITPSEDTTAAGTIELTVIYVVD